MRLWRLLRVIAKRFGVNPGTVQRISRKVPSNGEEHEKNSDDDPNIDADIRE